MEADRFRVDSRSMMTWTRDAVARFVSDRIVSLRDETVELMPVPSWILDCAAGESEATGGQRVAAIHPDDRDLLINAYLAALAEPNVTFEASYRIRSGDGWANETIAVVNLFELDDVGGILCALKRDDGALAAKEVESQSVSAYEHDEAAWMLGTVARSGTITHVEGRVQDLLGREPTEVIGHSSLDFLDPDSYEDGVPMWLSLFAKTGVTRTSRRQYVRPDGSTVWAEISYLSRDRADGEREAVFIAADITRRRAQEEALQAGHDEIRMLAEESRHQAREFRLLAEELPTAVFHADHTGRILFHNARWDTIVGADSSVTQLFDVVHPHERRRLRDVLHSLTTATSSERRSVQLRGRRARQVLELVCRVVQEPGAELTTIVGSIDDVSDALALRSRAEHDALTRLLNRGAMDAHIDEALRDGVDTLLAFIDLNGFKPVNDVHGHERGDLVLQTIAQRLAAAVRPDDLVSRYGGDEFVVLCMMPGQELDEEILRSRLAAVLVPPVTWPGGSWSAGASIGVARPVPGDDHGAVVRRADIDMLAAKRLRYAPPGGSPESAPAVADR